MNTASSTYADISRANARYLAEAVGGYSKFAEKVGLSDSQVSQILGKNPIRNIGVKTARRIEEAFDKPIGWIDQPHDENGITALTMGPADDLLSTEIRILRANNAKAAACLRAFETANSKDKENLVALALSLLEDE